MTEHSEHLPECWATYPSDPPAWCICDELRACEDRVREDERRDERSRVMTPGDRLAAYLRGFDDARWVAAKEALEAVQHEEPCDCEACRAIVRALAELRTIGNH